jgi:hypothetical protein
MNSQRAKRQLYQFCEGHVLVAGSSSITTLKLCIYISIPSYI